MEHENRPVYRVCSRQPIEELVMRGLPAVRHGERCIQHLAPGFCVHGGVRVHVRFLSDGVECCIHKHILRRVDA